MQHAERLCDRMLLIAKGRKMFDGTVAGAKGTVPAALADQHGQRPSIRSPGSTGIAEIKPLGESATNAGTRDWEIRLRAQASSQTVLEQCFQSGIVLHRFDHSEPSLHDAFVALVGADTLVQEEHA